MSMDPQAREELYQEWLMADQGCDMSWHEYQIWACPVCNYLTTQLTNHQMDEHP